MSAENIITLIPAVFHAAVVGLGFVVLTYLQRILRYQQRLMQGRSEQHITLQRIVNAAEDWYDDKKDSKDALRAAVERLRFPVSGYREDCLVVRVSGADVCDCGGPGWTCRVCGAKPNEPCDAGLHG